MFVSSGGSNLMGGGRIGITIPPRITTPVPKPPTTAPMQPVRTPLVNTTPIRTTGPVRPTSTPVASVTTPMSPTPLGFANGGTDGASVSPSFNVSGGAATATPATAGGSDYTWLLYVAGGLALAFITWKSMKKG